MGWTDGRVSLDARKRATGGETWATSNRISETVRSYRPMQRTYRLRRGTGPTLPTLAGRSADEDGRGVSPGLLHVGLHGGYGTGAERKHATGWRVHWA